MKYTKELEKLFSYFFTQYLDFKNEKIWINNKVSYSLSMKVSKYLKIFLKKYSLEEYIFDIKEENQPYHGCSKNYVSTILFQKLDINFKKICDSIDSNVINFEDLKKNFCFKNEKTKERFVIMSKTKTKAELYFFSFNEEMYSLVTYDKERWDRIKSSIEKIDSRLYLRKVVKWAFEKYKNLF